MPTKQLAAPIAGEISSIFAKEFVIIRAVAAGITSRAEMRSVPITRIVTKMVPDNITMSVTSMYDTRTPDTSATCGSNVANKNDR